MTPDLDRFQRHVSWLLVEGCHGVVIGGSTGEANSLSVGERMQLLDATIDAGIRPEQLIVGTGCCALSDTLALTTHALARGCVRILLLPPFYYKNVSDAGLVRSVSTLVDRMGYPGLQIILYHFPKTSAVPFSYDVIDDLLERYPDVIVGIKDSTGDRESTCGFIKRFPDLCVVPGTEALLLDALEAGGTGCISASANVNARRIRAVYDAHPVDAIHASHLQEGVTRVRKLLQSGPLIPILKRTLSEMMNDPEWLRLLPPFVETAPPLDAAVQTALTEAGLWAA
jgi:4-hydroxy-tetrahydrodipicolinate synthase